MCRSCAEGGRRCPSASGAHAREQANERRRRNRARHRNIVQWARETGQPEQMASILALASPSVASQWAHDHDAPEHLVDASRVDTGHGADSPPAGGVGDWITPRRLQHVEHMLKLQGQHPREALLLADTTMNPEDMQVREILGNTNITTEVILRSGKTAFHKPFAGGGDDVADSYGHYAYDLPLHEIAAWRLAAGMGPPWDSMVPTTVLRRLVGDHGALLAGMDGVAGISIEASTSGTAIVHAAAFFDAVIGQQDRHPGNYLVPTSSPTLVFGDSLALIDHGFAFATPGDLTNYSWFLDLVHNHGDSGQAALTDAEVGVCDRILADRTLFGIRGGIEDYRADTLHSRVSRMRASRRLLESGQY